MSAVYTRKIFYYQFDHAIFVPELVYIAKAAQQIEPKLNPTDDKKLIDLLQRVKLQPSPGLIALNLAETLELIKNLYQALDDAKIPLPPPVEGQAAQHWLTFKAPNKKAAVEVSITKRNPSWLDWVLTQMGAAVSLLLIMGLSASSAMTILAWGTGRSLLFYVIAKCISNYVDIKGGPEKRMRRTAAYLDRVWSGYYHTVGRWSVGKLFLNLTVAMILATSALVSWNYAFGMVKNLSLLMPLGEDTVYCLASIFAGSMFYSSFGRLFNPLYQHLYPMFARTFDMSEVDAASRLTPEKLQSCTEVLTKQEQSNDWVRVPRQVLQQFQQYLQREQANDDARNHLIDDLNPYVRCRH